MKTTTSSTLSLPDGSIVKASFPVVVSASRATDIPAFFAEWFSNRLAQGYCAWVNPFNAHQKMYVSFAKTRAFVFWSKNPRPLFRYLPQVEDMGIGYYFQYTLNDYDAENLEPGVASLERRVETFLELSQRIGPERVLWRFDPLLGGPKLPPELLLERINRVADMLQGATHKLVVSFADIQAYRKVQANLGKLGEGYRELTETEIHTICQGLVQLRQRTGLEVSTCAEDIDLTRYGITHNRCVDDDLLARLYPNDEALMEFIGRTPALQTDLFAAEPTPAKKDPGQRKACGCIVSKDIGAYNTCPHLCAYCYANASQESVLRKFARRNPNSELMLEDAAEQGATERVQPLVFHR
jgi:Domain of unknown function (DUF1848)